MTRREQGLFAAAGVVILLALVFARGLPWALSRWKMERGRYEQEVSLLARLRSEVAVLDELTPAADSIRREFAGLDTAILAGQSEAEARASLSAHLGMAADRAGALLVQAVPVADSTRAGVLGRLTARATLSGDTRGVMRTLRALTEDPVTLGIRGLRIVAADPASPDGAAETLSAELLISAWYLERPH